MYTGSVLPLYFIWNWYNVPVDSPLKGNSMLVPAPAAPVTVLTTVPDEVSSVPVNDVGLAVPAIARVLIVSWPELGMPPS